MNKKNKIENLCNHPNCKKEGVYKAPLNYDNLSLIKDNNNSSLIIPA